MKQVLMTLMVSLLSSMSMAATTGTLLLEGTVADNTSIQVLPNGSNLTLDIVNGESNKLVGTAKEISNNLAGYKILMKSLNGGKLKHTTLTSVETTYKLGYDGATTVSPTTTDVVVKTVNSLSGLTEVISDLRVDVTALPTAPTGVYKDTVTLTIQAQ